MKLNRVLIVNQRKRQLVAERVALDLYSPGRAEFTVVVDESDIKPFQLVHFDMGYTSQAKMQRWFVGLVDKVVKVGEKRVKLFCRELSSALSHPLPMNLRHVDLRDVVTEINRLTGLNFATPDADYSTTKVANFYNIGSGFQALNLIGRVFKINDFIWQQQRGVVWVGSWFDSRWAEIENMVLPVSLFDQHSANERVGVAALPDLRPGMRINGVRITQIVFEKNHMALSWKK